jgi:hypothetical protein
MLQLPMTRPLALPLVNPFSSFSPASLPDLAFWYDATLSEAVIDGGGGLASLSDLSGNGIDMLQPFGDAFRGQLQDGIFGTRKGVLFPASGTYDYHPGGAYNVPAVGTYFAAVKPSSLHVGGFIGRGANNNSTAGATIRCLTNNNAVQFIVGNGAARVEAVFREVYEAGTVLRCVARYDTVKLAFNLNGDNGALTGTDPVSTHNLGDCSTPGMRIGNSNELYRGHLGVAGFYTRYLTN